MANIIVKNDDRRKEEEHVMRSYGLDRRDPSMREAAEIAAARTREAVNMAQNRRRYFL